MLRMPQKGGRAVNLNEVHHLAAPGPTGPSGTNDDLEPQWPTSSISKSKLLLANKFFVAAQQLTIMTDG